MAVNPEERRRFPRVGLHTPLRYQVRGVAQFNNALSDNISLGGMSFVANEFIAPQTALMLEVNLLSRIIRPIGKISWATPLPHSDRKRLGIEFVEVDTDDKNYLAEYMDMQMQQL